MVRDPDLTQHYCLNEPEAITDVIDGESVIMNLGSGTYYGLDALSSAIWQRILSGETPVSVAVSIAVHFELRQADIMVDLKAFLAQLLEEALVISVSVEVGDTRHAEVVLPAGSYAPPRLTRYADMTRLLALDPPLPA